MKKLALTVIAGAAIAFTPFSSFALSPMTDSGLKDATGQAGVSIGLDNIKIEKWVGATKYIDADGIGAGDTLGGAAVVIGEKHTVQYFDAITDGTVSDNAQAVITASNAALVNTAVTNRGNVDPDTLNADFEARALTIDVGTCTALSAGFANNHGGGTVAGVVIGLPTITITTTADTYNVGIESATAVNGGNGPAGNTFIQISKGASVMAVLDGWLEIAPH